jgi:Domain of unknown function (DUF4145)
MNFNRNVWKKLSFDSDRNPHWPCPNCGGIIRLLKEKISIEQSKDLPDSVRYISKDETSNIGYIEHRFSGMFICDNCNLKIASVGYAHAFDMGRHPVNAGYFKKAGMTIFPTFFDPPLKLFSVSEVCPQNIKWQLENAFALYWNDRSSCANKIRIAIELLMDHQNVPNPKGMTLHDRILKFKEQNSLFGSFLESAKWIGNAGSHNLKELSKIDLLNGFEFMEHVINQLYPEKDLKLERLIKNSKLINENKGPKPR